MDIKRLGATGDSLSDDTAAIQAALDEAGTVVIPAGSYKITGTLLLRSNTVIEASPEARIFCAPHSCVSPDSYLLAGNDIENVTVRGGIWDGANKDNHRLGGLWDTWSNKGLLIRIVGAKNLVMENMTVTNAEAYYITLCRADGFRLENITFDSDTLTPNQDGIHLAGFCENGVLRGIRSARPGPTNDDMIAFNADDCMTRLTNLGLCCGPIRHISVEDVEAEDCYTLVRLLSVDSEISDVHMKNLRAGVRCNAFNVDAARYCAAPIFSDADRPDGVGLLRDITIENVSVWRTTSNSAPMSVWETNSESVTVRNFSRLRERECEGANDSKTFLFRKMRPTAITADSVKTPLERQETLYLDRNAIGELTIGSCG